MLRCFASFVFLLVLSGCDTRTAHTGPLQTSNFALEKAEVSHANVELNMKAGELRITGGSDKLIDGRLEYNVADFKPDVHSSVNRSRATVTVEQPHAMAVGGHERNYWDLRLNNEAVLDLSINCGAGKADLTAGSLRLRSLDVHMGAGKVDLDLSGHPRQDYDVEIAGGVGQATVHLPHDVGVRADLHGGLGSIKVEGLEKKGDHYENNLYEVAKVNVHVKVSGGIGEIRLED